LVFVAAIPFGLCPKEFFRKEKVMFSKKKAYFEWFLLGLKTLGKN
jgi:hypothetical protein